MAYAHNVCVTGLGFATCLGLDATSVIDRLKTLRHGIVRYPPFDRPEIPVKVAAPIPGFKVDGIDAEDWEFPDTIRFRKEQYRCLSPNVLYAVYAMEQAVADAGLSPEEISSPRVGMYTASGGSVMLTYEHMDRLKNLGPNRVNPFAMVASIAGTLSFNLVARFSIQGASTGFVSACASSGHALGFAFDEIASGRQDRMFVVGAEDFTEETLVPFGVMRVMTSQTDPDIASRPFDRGRDGFVGTGGSVVLVLESEKVARERGAETYCRLFGWGQSTDGYHVAISHPEGAGLRRAMENALESARISADQVDYINAHATSTLIGDVSECRALKSVFGAEPKVAISSTKALTGHALSLSSAMEASFCALAIKHGFIPGAAHLEDPDEEAAGLNFPRETLDEKPEVVLSNSSGFGGANVSVILGTD